MIKKAAIFGALVFGLSGCSSPSAVPEKSQAVDVLHQESKSALATPRDVVDTSSLIPAGWRETVISVTNADEMAAFYLDVFGWEIRARGRVPAKQLRAWSLPAEASAQYILVANPQTQSGYVRILQISGVDQARIRNHDQAWETGGIYNMNIRVSDMALISRKMTEAGWQADAAPVQFTFGPFLVWEWIPRHKDGVRVAISERVKPALSQENWPHFKTTSRTFNSTQIVADMDKALDFYQGVLGFKMYLDHRGASQAASEHVLGMPREAMTKIIREVYILNPLGDKNDGSIELLEFEGYSGRDFSERAIPQNLGNSMLRYPVPNIDDLATHFQEKGVALEYGPLSTDLPPYGDVKIMAVRAPDGAWLEFYQENR